MRRIALPALLLLAALSAPARTPKLIIYVSIDQMRADYFERYGAHFTGGFRRLHREGVFYPNADLNYATSETGPGHATLGTGCYPWKSGIQGNEWIDIRSMNDLYCVSDSTALPVDGAGGGMSPRNLMVTGLGDWLKARSPKSKVFTASTKDRAAILMGGKRPDGAFWYSKTVGGMVTSDYYMKRLPRWAAEFNASGWAEKNVPDQWTKSLDEAAYAAAGPDEFPHEAPWQEGSTAFPHPFTAGKKAEQISGSPFGDKLVLDFALSALRGEKLGQRGVTDLLCISLSNCDYVGHAMGPDSHEMLDLLVKIDRYLGEFFAAAEESVGKRDIVIALSADHAVCPLPEYNARFRGIDARRYNYRTEVKPRYDSVAAALKAELGGGDDIIVKNSFINYAAGAKAGLDSAALEAKVRAGLLAVGPYVDVYFRRELTVRTPSDRPFIEKYRNSYYAPRGEDYQLRIREHSIISSRSYGATHGSPYRYDTNVPVLFWQDGITPATHARTVHSADVAPTLARIAGIPLPGHLDGVPLSEVVKR
ncbi:MAG: alkaline phosphatase family protein [Bacteroidetes bacterium]|nr:MAG: alkaline phosphatase family protein [Bacteroidota bacterium]